MKISEYDEMVNYLTRPKVNSEGAFQREVDRQKANGTYGIGNKPTQPHLPGMDPKTVLNKIKKYEDDPVKKPNVVDYIEQTRSNYNDPPVVERRGQQTAATISTANQILNNQVKKGNIKKEDLILTADPTGLLTNKNKTIAMRDSFMAKQFNKALGVNEEPEASPEAFGKLAERLERDRQMRGAPTNVQRFEKNFNNINTKKPIIKKKRISTPEPIKINLDDYKPFIESPRIEADPQSKIMEARFNEIVRQTAEEKSRRENSGLVGLLNTGKKFI